MRCCASLCALVLLTPVLATGQSVGLGLRLAHGVLSYVSLLGAGLAADLVELASHGETNPVVATADNTDEAKNRRVEVTVR